MKACRKLIAPILMTFAILACIAMACVATFILKWVWIPYLFLSFIPVLLFATTRKHFGGFAFAGDVLAIFKNGQVIKGPYLWDAIPEHFRTLSIVFLGTLFAALLAYWFVRPAYRRRSSDGP